jgi:hypothetical protein
MKKIFVVIPVLLVIVFWVLLSGCGGGSLPKEAEEALDRRIRNATVGTPEYTIVELMKAPRKENAPNYFQKADEIWCVLVEDKHGFEHFLVYRTGLNWSARDLYKSIFLDMECNNVGE